MQDIKIRQATIADLPALLEFEQGLILAERPFDPSLKPGDINYYDLPDLMENENAKVVVAMQEEQILGCGYAIIRENKPYYKHRRYGYFGFMFVKPESRGLGINGLVMEDLKQWCISKGIRELQLRVYAENTSAIKAYEKTGFKSNMIEMKMEL